MIRAVASRANSRAARSAVQVGGPGGDDPVRSADGTTAHAERRLLLRTRSMMRPRSGRFNSVAVSSKLRYAGARSSRRLRPAHSLRRTYRGNLRGIHYNNFSLAFCFGSFRFGRRLALVASEFQLHLQHLHLFICFTFTSI